MKTIHTTLSRFTSALIAGVSLLLVTPSFAYKRIYVHTDADDAYLAQRSQDKPESYYFYEGLFFGGYTRDSELDDTPFIEVAKGLAPNLAKQNYFPAVSKDTADLLLIVSWGVTNPEFYRDLADSILLDRFDGNYYDNLAAGRFNEDDFTWYGLNRNSKLVGFWPYLRWEIISGITPYEEYELRAALRSRRYFIIVTAFDFQELITNKQWKREWSTRFSIRSPGISFPSANLALSQAGASYFGKKMHFLGTEKAIFNPVIAQVEIGKIEVLETIDAPEGPGILNSLRMPDKAH